LKSNSLVNKLASRFNDELTQIIAGLSFERPAFFVGLSGGVDSCALLKLLSDFKRASDERKQDSKKKVTIYALHFNHQLQEESAQWRDFCKNYALNMGCEFISIDADFDIDKKQGIESSARKARYEWFQAVMQSTCEEYSHDNTMLFTGHHSDDQAETILMNMLRGTGINGLRGIARFKKVAVTSHFQYVLARPLLEFSKAELIDFMQNAGKQWIEDPSNQESKFRRNALRHKVLPALKEIRPDASIQLGRLAEKAVDIESILFDMAALDLGLVSEHYGFCPLDGSYGLNLKNLHVLSLPRQLNALRYWLDSVGYPANSEMDLLTVIDWSMQDSSSGAMLQRNERCYRYYRGVVYVMPVEYASSIVVHAIKRNNRTVIEWADSAKHLNLMDCFDGFSFLLSVNEQQTEPGLTVPKSLSVHFKETASQLFLRGSNKHINTKNLLQEYGVPAWRREQALFIANEQNECIAVVGGQKSSVFELSSSN